MKLLVIIPARLASERLPNKPLLKIGGKTMILHTAQRALQSGIGPVAVATDSELVFKEVQKEPSLVPVMTSAKHSCGTERVLEAYQKLAEQMGSFDLIVNLQGDEPFVDPEMLKKLPVELEKRRKRAEFWTTVAELPPHEQEDRNVAKVVLNQAQNALIFTRDPIEAAYKHTSVYIYTPAFLEKFCALPPTELEKKYRLEQMRALDHGLPLNCIPLPFDAVSINTIEDLEKAGVSDYSFFED